MIFLYYNVSEEKMQGFLFEITKERDIRKGGSGMRLKEKLQKHIKEQAVNSVGKSLPSHIHEPKVPAALKAAKSSQK